MRHGGSRLGAPLLERRSPFCNPTVVGTQLSNLRGVSGIAKRLRVESDLKGRESLAISNKIERNKAVTAA